MMKMLKNECFISAWSRSICTAGAILAFNGLSGIGAMLMIGHLVFIVIVGAINE